MWAPDIPAHEHVTWVREEWEKIRPFSTGGNYVNFQLAEDDADRTAAAYEKNFERSSASRPSTTRTTYSA